MASSSLSLSYGSSLVLADSLRCFTPHWISGIWMSPTTLTSGITPRYCFLPCLESLPWCSFLYCKSEQTRVFCILYCILYYIYIHIYKIYNTIYIHTHIYYTIQYIYMYCIVYSNTLYTRVLLCSSMLVQFGNHLWLVVEFLLLK